MSQKPTYKKILEHPDKEEIISQLIIGKTEKDISEWLQYKYTNVSEAKFVISDKTLKSFKDTYLDFYKDIREDMAKSKTALANNEFDGLELSVKNDSLYKSKMKELAGKELNVREMLANMILAVETRTAQLYDMFQSDPSTINTRSERLLLDYFDKLGIQLERYHKFLNNVPDQVIQHNVTIQHIDQQVSVILDAIKETLSMMDIEASLYFMEVFNKQLSKLKAPKIDFQNTEERLAEVKLLNEKINKLNE